MKGWESLAEVKLKYDYDCVGKNSGKENDYYSKLNIFNRERERVMRMSIIKLKSAGLIGKGRLNSMNFVMSNKK